MEKSKNTNIATITLAFEEEFNGRKNTSTAQSVTLKLKSTITEDDFEVELLPDNRVAEARDLAFKILQSLYYQDRVIVIHSNRALGKHAQPKVELSAMKLEEIVTDLTAALAWVKRNSEVVGDTPIDSSSPLFKDAVATHWAEMKRSGLEKDLPDFVRALTKLVGHTKSSKRTNAKKDRR